MNQRRIGSRLIWCGLWLFACTPLGCTPRTASVESSSKAAPAEIELHLLVVDDPGMAAAIGRLRGDWKARTGATISISEMTAGELLARESCPSPIDALIFPSGQLGPLAQRDWIGPLPSDYATSADLDWPDVFELLQVGETCWAGVPHGVSFGSPVLTCFYRADLLRKISRRVPQTWSEYHQLAEFLGRRENLGDSAPAADAPWHGTLEPLAPGWAGRTLLARAAPYARHRDHYSTLFNIDTMEPLVAGPAFVRALEELVADARLGSSNVLQLDPAAVRREFLAGHTALAISWPSRAGSGELESVDLAGKIGFFELPGSPRAYNIASRAWESRPSGESTRVPLLGLAGRIGSIARASSYPEQAFGLLAWLSGRDWGSTTSAASAATTLFRKSQMRAPRPWLDPSIDAAAGQQYARSVRDAFGRSSYLFAPRIEGQEEYLAALDTAVAQAVRGEKSPADALKQAASEWSTITQRLGHNAQRKAYRKSLGLEP